MPFYNRIDSDENGRRTASRLLALRDHLKREIPRSARETLLMATWNIREFDSAKYGQRLDESYYYIAEIISHFDMVAIQEVREDLSALERLLDILGGWWSYVLTDVTEGRAGNRERMAFVYDKRKLRFGGLAAEVVIPPPAPQLARTPFLCGFKAGWFKFMVCTVHILYGGSTADEPRRVEEIRTLAQQLARRVEGAHPWCRNLVLLGDFNIFNRGDVTMEQLEDAGFAVPPSLQSVPGSNVAKNKHYDQIAFLLQHQSPLADTRAGVFDFFDTVFCDDDEDVYRPLMGHYASFRQWRTHQMSDHLPMWIELGIDFSDDYLRDKAAPQPTRRRAHG